MMTKYKIKDVMWYFLLRFLPLFGVYLLTVTYWSSIWKKSHNFLCNPIQTPALMEITRGRNESEFPSMRCCEDHHCLRNDRGRYAVLTTLRSDNYYQLLVNLECTLRKSNPTLNLIVATVKGDLSGEIEQAIRNLSKYITVVYWEDFFIENKLKSRFALNWV